MGNLNEYGWVYLKFIIFIVLIDIMTAQECCPENGYLIENSSICSDNITSYKLNCKQGALLLDPSTNENDKFSVESDGSLSFFDGQRISKTDFCLGKLLRNETENSETSVALVCFDDEWSQSQSSVILRLLMLISTVFIVLTLYIYVVLPNLRDLQGKCVIAFICCLLASYVTLLVTQTFPNSSKEMCIFQAASLYFFMSATFFWNNIITFNIWRAIRNASIQNNKKSYTILYMTWGFGMPLGMVLLSFILENLPSGNHVRPNFGETKCWFTGKLETWVFFYGPISILLLANTAMFLHSSWILWKIYKVSNTLKLKSLKFKYVMYLKLLLLMGISWTFEVISFATNDLEGTNYFWFITDCLNSAQGIIIFLILVVFRQKVRLGILKKKLFNINWPQSWAAEEIQESSTGSLKEEVEMANQKSNLLT